MWANVEDITRTVLGSLPEITVGLRFFSALLGLGLTVDAVGRRLRRRRSEDDPGPLN